MSAEAKTVDVPKAEALAPLIAVCGIGGGAGASTLAFLTAMYVQRFAKAPILLCDAGGPGASLALMAEEESELSLPQAASAIAADALAVPLFAQVTGKLRLIARDPELDDFTDPEGLERLLRDARRAHPVTIVDCGSLQRPVERLIAKQASSILWVARGSVAGAKRAKSVLRSLPMKADREILAVSGREERDSSSEHELMSAAELRGASLVFVPPLPEVCDGNLGAALEAGQLALEAIRGRLA
jgi:Flp pilus assembly CpaE family ATPase